MNPGALWSHGSVRRVLRNLRRPAMLERDEIALELKRALRCEVARDAVLMLVERALRHEHRFCAELVRRCDVDGETTAAVAGALHLSPRQFFRYRAHAMEAIGVELEATLTRTRSHRPSAGAARAVVLGRLLLSRVAQADVSSAMRHFERAVTIDPLCVEAYAGMSIGWLLLSRELAVTPVHAHAKALSLAKRAVALDPHSAAAHSAFARVALDSGLGRAIAAPHVSEALSLDPFDARAHVANWNLALIDGDLGAAERSGGQAISLEPASFSNALCQMATTFYRCDYSATVEQAGELIAIEPRSRAVRVYLADALDASGRPEETLALLQPGDRIGDDPYELASAAHARALIGDRDGARRTLDKMLQVGTTYEVPRYLVAYARLATGDVHAALDDLESAVREDPGWLTVLEHDPALVELHAESRFRRLISLRPNAIG